jgi:molybdopterin synthase catalytic subunit
MLEVDGQIKIQEADFDLAIEYEKLRTKIGNSVGAIVGFTGLVREQQIPNERERLTQTLRLEHYPGMTEASIERILVESAQRWELLGQRVIHRVGNLEPSDQIVLVLIASKHRPDAFAACEFVMDYLKTKAVFWKYEGGEDRGTWVTSTASDFDRLTKWS